MTATSDTGKVTVHFGWTGPTTWRGGWKNGGLDVGCIDLIFQNVVTKVSVSIPHDLDPQKISILPFTCRRDLPWKETHPKALSLRIEQIRQLQLSAAFLEKSPVSTWTMMDHHGNITHDRHAFRSDRKISFQAPPHLEVGKTYLLQVTSEDLSLSASLVEEPNEADLSVEEKSIARDQSELFGLLGGVLLPLMGLKLMEFSVRIVQTSSGSSFVATPNVDPKTIGIEFIQKAIQNIEKPVLKLLAADLRQAKAAHSGKSLEEKTASEKQIIKASFDAMGLDSLQTIMRSNLESIIQSEITPEMREIIDSIAVRFQEICMSHVS